VVIPVVVVSASRAHSRWFAGTNGWSRFVLDSYEAVFAFSGQGPWSRWSRSVAIATFVILAKSVG
jgi:hypothetical protein